MTSQIEPFDRLRTDLEPANVKDAADEYVTVVAFAEIVDGRKQALRQYLEQEANAEEERTGAKTRWSMKGTANISMSDPTLAPTPTNQQEWIDWVKDALPDHVVERTIPDVSRLQEAIDRDDVEVVDWLREHGFLDVDVLVDPHALEVVDKTAKRGEPHLDGSVPLYDENGERLPVDLRPKSKPTLTVTPDKDAVARRHAEILTSIRARLEVE